MIDKIIKNKEIIGMAIVSIALIGFLGISGLFGVVLAWGLGLAGWIYYKKNYAENDKDLIEKFSKQKNDQGEGLSFVIDGKPWILKEEIKKSVSRKNIPQTN